MFSWNEKDAFHKFPASIIFNSRFRGSFYYNLLPADIYKDYKNEEKTISTETKLGNAMKELFRCTWTNDKNTKSCENVINNTLNIIKKERNISNINEQYDNIKEIAIKRDKNKEYPYNDIINNKDMDKLWGITQQLRFGLLLREILKEEKETNILLDPCFTCLLNPTGGILGSPPFWLHSKVVYQEGPLNYRRVCKDVIWYYKIYHNNNNKKTKYDKYSSIFQWYWITLCVKKFPTWY